MSPETSKQTFWEHLDELRSAIVKILIVAIVFAIIAFCFKDQLFAIVLAPKEDSFVTYRLLDLAASLAGESIPSFSVRLVNTGLAQQFVIHMKMALWAGVLCTSPYILYQLFRFVSPALYDSERRYATSLVGGGYLMFALGVLLCYFLIFPLTFRFLGTYQVSTEVANLITLDSYISTLIAMSLSLGIIFEIPILAWLLAKMGLISSSLMRRYRRHAIVIILVVAAIITPTSDIFTLLLVALPMYLLYELSILIVNRVGVRTR